VVVVGAGPAGLQAARIAAERGHDVALLGASAQPGGKLRWEAALPGRAEHQRLIDWMMRGAEQAGVTFSLGRAASVDALRALDPDHVVLATGSHQRRPDGFDGAGVTAREWAIANGSPAGTAVLFDMDHSAATYAVADALAARHQRLVLLTPRTQLARNVNYCSAIGIHRRLYAAGVEIVLAVEPVSLESGVLAMRNVFTGEMREIADVALFVWSTPRIADDALAQPLQAAGIDTRLVGDCMAPRNLLCAIHEGEAAAMML
jgi:NADPH-dependent 2,4-dienoyl-CoA reductase/sulfur reductase-like enzyme